MRRAHTALTILLAVALAVLAIFWKRPQREFQRQVEALTKANATLKETLGEMTVAITKKEKQIDDLQQAPCGAGDRKSDSLPAAPSRKVQPPKSGAGTNPAI